MGSALLASDLNNPDYVGATNPDSRLAVRFFSAPEEDVFQSLQQGRPIFRDVEFIEIAVPGDTTTRVVAHVREDHKQRFPLHWAHYQNKHGGDAREIGTPLSQWPRLSQAQCEELRALKFHTVESVASASDQQLQRIGMVAGMSPYAFRDAAVRFLALAKDDSTVAEAEARAKALEEENKALKEQVEKDKAETQAELAVMRKMIADMADGKPKGKPGPKPKGKPDDQLMAEGTR